MSTLLEPPKVRPEPTGLRERIYTPVFDSVLTVVGALVAGFGVYTYYAPTDWIWADLAEGWHLGSWVLGGLLMAIGLGRFGFGMRTEDGHWSARAITGVVLATLALAGAVTFGVIWALADPTVVSPGRI